MLLDEVLTFNQTFVQNKEYLQYETSKFPDKRIVILSCMDTRLVELLPKSLNLKNGDVKLIKNAGAIISHPFGSVMRSILLSVYQLQANEVFIIGHYDCGMQQHDGSKLLEKMKGRIPTPESIDLLKHAGVDLEGWLNGFDHVESAVKHSVSMVRNHPLLPKKTPVHGLVINPKTGELTLIDRGY